MGHNLSFDRKWPSIGPICLLSASHCSGDSSSLVIPKSDESDSRDPPERPDTGWQKTAIHVSSTINLHVTLPPGRLGGSIPFAPAISASKVQQPALTLRCSSYFTAEGDVMLRRHCLLFNYLVVFAALPCWARADVFHMAPGLTSLQFVTVGDPGNAADTVIMAKDGTTGYGSVPYTYRIGTYDVTNAQYVEFLNSKDPTGANLLGLWNDSMSGFLWGGIQMDMFGPDGDKYTAIAGRENHPVVAVTWYDAIRFANWLNNGQGQGDTETGAYTLLGGTPNPSNGLSITRNPGAKVFLPSENEWYKAAFYNANAGTYYQYPTSSNTKPISSDPTDLPNHANYMEKGYELGQPTDVGAYTETTSPCGAFDMAGNVWQWNESLIGNSSRGLRGGSFYNSYFDNLLSSVRADDLPTAEEGGSGFRVAAVVPEPSTAALAVVACGVMTCLMRSPRRSCREILMALPYRVKPIGACSHLFCVVALLTGATAKSESVQWISQFGTSLGDLSHGVFADGTGSVYATGATEGALAAPNPGDFDVFLRKYDSAGNVLWTRQLGTQTFDYGYGVSGDGMGNVYVSGVTLGSLSGAQIGNGDAFLNKFDSSGNLIWARQFGTTKGDGAWGVSADGAGSVYAAGYTFGSLGGPNVFSDRDAFLSRFDDAGNLLWSRQLGTSSQLDQAFGVTADKIGNVFITGETTGDLAGPNVGGNDAFVSKYDSTGNLIWTRQLGTSADDRGSGVSADGLGNVYVSGETGGDLSGNSFGNTDAFLGKYDSQGNLLWLRQAGTSDDDFGAGVSVDSSGSIYLAGTIGEIVGKPTDDAFVSRYDSAGNLLWTRQLGTTSIENTFAVSADGHGNVYTSGATYGNFGTANAGSYDAFVVKIGEAPEPASIYLLAMGGLVAFCAWKH
jgi:formylglycine-generating enzyme required for sulfatase activity